MKEGSEIKRTTAERTRGATALLALKRAGERGIVSMVHATHRQEICQACPMKVAHPNMSYIDTAGTDLFNKAVRDLNGTGGYDEEFRGENLHCGVCGCPLFSKTKLHANLATYKMTQEEVDEFPQFCWLVTESGLEQSQDAKGREYQTPSTLSGCASCGS